jgi:rod shape-determining protein MreC
MAVTRVRGSRGRLAVLVLAAVTILVLDQRNVAAVDGLRGGAGTVFRPFATLAENASSPLGSVWDGLTGWSRVNHLEDENRDLRERNAELEALDVAEQDAAHQLAELSAAVDIPWAGDLPRVTAEVTSGPLSNFSHAIEINKGSGDGIHEGMPVVTGGGLVGQVTHVTSGHATIGLITDPESRVGVRLAETGEMGTARGQGQGEPLIVDTGIDPGAEVADGSGLVTSGVDRSTYPAAIPVARVGETREGAGGLSLELVVEPLVDVDRLSYVSVILWEPPA